MKIFKKAAKLHSFLPCPAHIFLGHDDCLVKTNLRIVWNQSNKNFQVRHGQCDSIVFPETFGISWKL